MNTCIKFIKQKWTAIQINLFGFRTFDTRKTINTNVCTVIYFEVIAKISKTKFSPNLKKRKYWNNINSILLLMNWNLFIKVNKQEKNKVYEIFYIKTYMQILSYNELFFS